MATQKQSLDYRPSYLAASSAAAAVFALYVYTLAPSTAMWDTSEYISAAYRFGLPHPPGNPFFVIIGRVFSLLPIAPNIAMRINLLAAVCSALTAGLWFLIAERVLVGWLPQRWQRIAGGALASLIGATAFTVWAQSVVNEKVYTVALFGLAVVAWLIVKWCDEPDGRHADKLLVLAAYLMGLGYANHMAGFLAGPAAVVAVLLRRPKTIVRWKLILGCVGALGLGLTPFATQPIRAAYFPAVNEGEPTGCREKLTISCTFSKKTLDAFKYNFNRGQYAKPPLTERQAPFSAQIGMWWYYFRWQWIRDVGGTNGGLQGALAAVFLALGLLGGWVHYKRDRNSFTFFGPLMVTLTLVLIYYLNFKYGNSQPGPPGLAEEAREVRDRDYFFLWSFSAWSVWAALGLLYVWESLAALLGTDDQQIGTATVSIPKRTNWLIASPILALALIPLFANFDAASRRGDTDTADFARDMLNSVEPYGILIAVGDNDTFPLWYAQEVEGVRRDVLVANTSLMNTDWYVRQMIRRPVEAYDEAKGPSYFRGKQWKKPTGPVLKMTFDEADSVPLMEPLQNRSVFTAGNIHAIVDPGNLHQPGVLERADILVYHLIADNPDRSVHFARSSGYYANELGFTNYLAMYGLTRKLERDSIKESPTMRKHDREGWIDVAATESLWNEYAAPASLIRKHKWIDRPSLGIPFLYVTSGLSLSEALEQMKDTTRAENVFSRVRALASAVGLEEVIQPPANTNPTPLIDTARSPISVAPHDTTKVAPSAKSPGKSKAPPKKPDTIR